MPLKGACLFGQSGGPTSVINASAYGVFKAALASEQITRVLGAAHGIKGILSDTLYDIGQEDARELELLLTTPSSALGSCRYKLKDAQTDDTDYKKILSVFTRHDIRYFFYNGGNDSMDTCNKISKYLLSQGYECRVIGIPKTIDNDLHGTDHSPGFGSAAKYIAAACAEVMLDTQVYDTPSVTIIETMGRNAGWLTAAAGLAGVNGRAPDLIFMPEIPFCEQDFLARVKRAADTNGSCLAVVAEGVRTASGQTVVEAARDAVKTDAFGHKQMGGAAQYLAEKVSGTLGLKVRAIELSLLQRCAAHCGSQTDVNEAFDLGACAVKAALSGVTDKMVALERAPGPGYHATVKLCDLTEVANAEKTFPLEWIDVEHSAIRPAFYEYALPLIAGNTDVVWENGLPRFARLKKVPV